MSQESKCESRAKMESALARWFVMGDVSPLPVQLKVRTRATLRSKVRAREQSFQAETIYRTEGIPKQPLTFSILETSAQMPKEDVQ